MTNLYHIIIYSFRSSQFYKDVFFNLKKIQLKYLLFIVFITSLPGVVMYYFLFSNIIASGAFKDLINEFPDIKIENYKMVDQFKDPYRINIDGKNVAVFVSDDKLINKMAKENYQAIFFPDGFKLLLGSSYQASDYTRMFPDGSGVINKELLNSGYEYLNKYKWLLIFGPLLVVIFVQRLFSVAVEVALFAAITYLFNRLFFTNKNYVDFFRLMIFAFFPYLIIESMSVLIPLSLVSAYSFLCVVVKVGYAYFATKSIRSV